MEEKSTGVATASGAGRDSRSNLLSLLQTASGLFGTGKQTTSETVSAGKNLTPQQIQALMNSMMSSSQGLASVLLPQRQAGLYNSNVNNLLAQQMATQVAAKAAELGTPTTSTSTKSVQTGASPMAMPLAGLLGGLQAVSLAKSAAASETGQKVLGALKGTSADPLSELLDAGSSQLLVDNAAFGTQMADWASTVSPDVLTGFGADAGSLAFSDIGSLASSASVPYMAIGNVASNALEGVLGNNVFSNAWQGVMEPVNEVVGGVTSAVEDAFKGIGDALGGGKVICTELHRQGLMSDEIYAADCAYEKLQSQELIVGYHFWAKPLVKLMKKSKFVTGAVRLLADPWSREMAYRMGALDKSNITGKVIMAIGYPICEVIGTVILAFRSKKWAAS